MGPQLLSLGTSLGVKDGNPELAAIKYLPLMWIGTQNNSYGYKKIKVFIVYISFCELRCETETPDCILCVGTRSSHSKLANWKQADKKQQFLQDCWSLFWTLITEYGQSLATNLTESHGGMAEIQI